MNIYNHVYVLVGEISINIIKVIYIQSMMKTIINK